MTLEFASCKYCSCKMLHFVMSHINQNKKRKQTHEISHSMDWKSPLRLLTIISILSPTGKKDRLKKKTSKIKKNSEIS